MTSYTVLGASGFLGSALVRSLRSKGANVLTPARTESLAGRQLGHVIYCIGLTADFRQRPFDTVKAHVSFLSDVLENSDFQSLLYLSSTRVYAGACVTQEDSPLTVTPGNASDLYNLSKLLGEALCLNCGKSNVRVARLSNVVGYDPGSGNFLMSLIAEALSGKVRLGTALSSCKDYIDLDDVISLLPRIAQSGRKTLYNVASGQNMTHQEVCSVLQKTTGCLVEEIRGAVPQQFPGIDVQRIEEEFAFHASDPLLHVPQIIERWKDDSLVR